MKHAIDPTIDCVFKAILGSNEHINLLLNFLNAICKDDLPSPVCDLTIQNPYNEKEFLSDKLSIVDIKANDKSGNTFQIEIQLSVPSSLKYRMLHNWASLYSRQLIKGESWNSLKPVISIWLVNLPVFSKFTGFHSCFSFYDEKNNLQIAEHAKIHVIELSKWHKSQVENDLDIWTNFFKEGKSFSIEGLPDGMHTREMEEAMSVLKQFSEKEQDYDRYLLRVEYLREQQAMQEDKELAEAKLAEAKIEIVEKDNVINKKNNAIKEVKAEIAESQLEIELLKKQLQKTL